MCFCHIPPNWREGGNGHARLWSTRAQCRYGKRRPHTSLWTNTRTSYRTIWRRDPKIPRVHFLPRRRQDLCLPSHGDAPEHTEESTFWENAKRLQGRRHRNPQDINGKGPGDPCVNPTGIFTKHGSRDNASDEQSSNDEGNGRKCEREWPDQVLDDGVSGYRTSDPAHYTTTTKMQVTHVALQTDSCDTLYITKNRLH